MVRVEKCPEDLWLSLCREDSSCTFYQTPLWYRAVEEFSGGDTHPILFDFGKTQAVLPLVKTKRPLFNLYFAPFGTYSGLVCPEKLSKDQLETIAQCANRTNYHFVPSPFSHNQPVWDAGSENFIQVIPLNEANREDPILIWDREQRRRTRVAAKRGVTVRKATGAEDVDAFYNIYQRKLNRWGSSGTSYYPRELFQALWKALGTSPHMQLWLAHRNGKLVGGYLAFYWNKHMVAWHGGADNESFKHGVSQVLFKHMLEDTVRRGFEFFDLTMSSGHEGVIYYKDQLGTRRVPFIMASHTTPLYGIVKKVKNFSFH